MQHLGGVGDFNVVFVGAGNIMFGACLSSIRPRAALGSRLPRQARTKGPGTTPSASNSTSPPPTPRRVAPRASRTGSNPLCSARSKLGPRLKVVAIIDPAVDRAKATLQKKCETFVRSAYQNTKVFRTLDEFVAGMSPNDAPRAFVVGSPPMFRGTTQPRRDVELQILKHFPGVALFVEKPVATGPKEEIAESFKVAEAIQQSGSICSVG